MPNPSRLRAERTDEGRLRDPIEVFWPLVAVPAMEATYYGANYGSLPSVAYEDWVFPGNLYAKRDGAARSAWDKLTLATQGAIQAFHGADLKWQHERAERVWLLYSTKKPHADWMPLGQTAQDTIRNMEHKKPGLSLRFVLNGTLKERRFGREYAK